MELDWTHDWDWLMAVKTEGSWEEETWLVHTLGRGQASVLCGTDHWNKAGAPAGTLVPSWGWQWTLPGEKRVATQVPLGGSQQGGA